MEWKPKNQLQYPEGNVLLRNLWHTYPVISHGKGVYLFDRAGKRYFDASSGALVVSVGHGNEEVVSRISEQILKVAYVNGMQFTSEAVEKLAAHLSVRASGLKLTRASFLSSGSEAVEAAIKFARQLHVERGEHERSVIISRVPSYHGNTIFALSISGRPHYKKWYGPLLYSQGSVIAAPYEYRSQVEDYQRQGGAFYADLLEKAILKVGADKVAAFIAEPVIGSSAGATLPPPDYFKRVEEICKKHGVLMIADEVLCGSGRTGKFFASEHFNFHPDIVVLGKGLNGGYAPLSAVLVREEHLAEIKSGSGGFMHAQTYMQNPASVAAGLAVMEYFEKHRVVENAAARGKSLQDKLRQALSDHPCVGFVTGVGLLAGIEFVENKKTQAPFERSKKIAERFVSFALENGLILWPNVGQADGHNGDLVMVGPPLTISEAEVTEMVALIQKVTEEFFATRL